MSLAEMATLLVPAAITAGMYLYLLGERRKLDARKKAAPTTQN